MALAETALRRITPLEPRRMQQAIARLQALPAFYPAVHKALSLIEDPDSGDDHLRQVICSDQAMAGGVLRLANSASFGYCGQVHTISLAIQLIGRQKLATLLRRFLAEELIAMLSGRKPAAAHLREMSLATATAAYLIAEQSGRSDREEILLAGLLHNIGEFMLLYQFRDHYQEALRLHARLGRAEAEKAVFGLESRLVGKQLLEAWNFPPFFLAAGEHSADPWAADPSAAPLEAIAIIYAGRNLAEAWLAGWKADEVCVSLSPRLYTTLAVERQFLTEIYSNLPAEITRLQSALV